MANSLASLAPRLLAQGLMALRENAVASRLVNRGYESMAGERGSTIDVPIPSAIAAQEVQPANTPPSTGDIAPTHVPIVLDNWWESPFYMTDRDRMEVMEGHMPSTASEAIRSLVNKVTSTIYGKYTKFYGHVGTAGTTPFGTSPGVSDAINLRKRLNEQLAPFDPRHCIMDPDAEAAALGLSQFQDGTFAGSYDAIVEGNLNRKLGMQWWMDQLVPTHTAGTASASGVTVTLTSDSSAGDESVTLDVGSGTATLVEGDLISFDGHDQQYTVTEDVTLTTSGVSVGISPALKVDVDGSGTAVATTVEESHVANIAFHRDAIALATRPLVADAAEMRELGSIIQSAVDPVTQLALRLEISREHKRVRYSFDMLWGVEVIRPELGARLLG